MSSFGVKVPIRRAVLTEDFSYWNAQDIYDYLIQLFRNDSENEIEVEKEILGSYGIKKCRSLYMISYFPDGFMMTIMQVDTSLPHAFLCHVTKSFPFFPNKAWKIKKIEVSTYFYLSLVFTCMYLLGQLIQTVHDTLQFWHYIDFNFKVS